MPVVDVTVAAGVRGDLELTIGDRLVRGDTGEP